MRSQGAPDAPLLVTFILGDRSRVIRICGSVRKEIYFIVLFVQECFFIFARELSSRTQVCDLIFNLLSYKTKKYDLENISRSNFSLISLT